MTGTGSQADESEIVMELRGTTAVVTLNRPDHLNAFTSQMVREWLEVFDQIDNDDMIRSVVVTGRGRAFCSGADLRPGKRGELGLDERQPGGWRRDNAGYVALRVYECTKPVLAAINGSAVGVGLTMTLPMDLRFIAEEAKLGFVFGARGITLDAASSWFLPRVVGINTALEWCLSARLFGAEEALAAGLAHQVCPSASVLDSACAAAEQISANCAPVSAALIRRLLWTMTGEASPMTAHLAESRLNSLLRSTPDAKEGVRAFLERRPPVWTMRPSEEMPNWARQSPALWTKGASE